jgi:choline dehydrogenase-like flavoprotein
MISDAEKVEHGACLRPDVCIVGAGAAGISLALSLTGQGLQVLLLESGRMQEDATTQALYAGEVVDERLHSPTDKYRQRRLGGTTAIWGGRCVPFDPIDFEKREWVADSGWPIRHEDLAPFYPQANQLAEAGRFAYDADEVFGPGGAPLIRQLVSKVVRTNSLERFSCPTNFGERYEARLRVARDIEVLLGANCTRVVLEADGRAVREVSVSTLGGKRFRVAARSTVLALGGLETARLLLASRDVAPLGVGNDHDVVGRYYMCHIAGNVGQLTLSGSPSEVQHAYLRTPEGIYCRRRMSIAPEEQRRCGLLNAVARLHFPRIADPAHANGVLSGLFLARNFISYEYSKRLRDGEEGGLALKAQHLRNVLCDPLDTAAFLGHWALKRTLASRKYPSVILRNRTNRFSLEMHAEQAPRRESRVTLTDSVDALGVPRLRVDWRYHPQDIASVRRMLDLIAVELQQTGAGRLEYNPATLEEELMRFGAYGGHHIGTTRMGSDPRNSVVNADCRVHGVDNLYIASSSVFATSSQANPTLTMLALSLRLGKHIGQRLRAVVPTGRQEVRA